MANLNDYYKRDFSRFLSFNLNWQFEDVDGQLIEVVAGKHLDFNANSFFVSYFVPKINNPHLFFTDLLNKLKDVVNAKNDVLASMKAPGESEMFSSDLKFSGRIFFYYEGLVDEAEFKKLKDSCKPQGIFIHLRDIITAQERSKVEHPLAFISHDSRDKELIASQIAFELQKKGLPIWYDEYSLKLGDSLRESIEKGLKECKKCILVLSPNFLSNMGWTKTEFNSIFTREIIENQNLVLPIWAGVSKDEIYEYSPTLINRIGVNWDKGIDHVIYKIQQALIN